MKWRGNNVEITGAVASGRLSGYTRAVSDLPGGIGSAKELFERMAGREPAVGNGDSKSPTDRFFGPKGEIEVSFRPASGSGGPVVEIIDHNEETFEKVHF
jgi:hypothetical protein